MKGALAAFTAGLGVAVSGALLWDRRRASVRTSGSTAEQARASLPERPALHPAESALDLNAASADQLRRLGLDPELVDRVIEHRPYRNKLDLVSQLVLPREVYERFKHSLRVDGNNEAVKIA